MAEKCPGKVSPHQFAGRQTPFPKSRASFLLPLGNPSLGNASWSGLQGPRLQQQQQQLEGWARELGSRNFTPPPLCETSTPHPSIGHSGCYSLLLFLVTWKCRPGHGSQSLPSIQLFSGPAGRWEDQPPGQAHFPEPGLPAPSPGTLSRHHWHLEGSFAFHFAWKLKELYMKNDESERVGKTHRDKPV